MELLEAQADLRKSYVRGGPGAIVSGVVWLTAAITSSYTNVATGFGVLFFGGMLIFPLAIFIVRVLYRRGKEAKGNQGGLTVIETVFPMIGCLLAAFLLLPHRPDLVFPVAAVAVGAHYFGFRTAYGDRTYWILASIMCGIGLAVMFTNMPSANSVPYLIAATEILFGFWLIWKDYSETRDEN